MRSSKASDTKTDTSHIKKTFSRTTIQTSFCILIATTISGGTVFAAKRDPGQGYQQVLQAQLQSAESEKRLESQMHVVARMINQCRLESGHFPEEGAESDRLQQQMSAAVGSNAYFEVKIEGANSPKNEAVTRAADVSLQVNLALSPLQLPDIRKSPARFCKTARPGTIVVLHNTEDYFLIWGAGIDGKPIKASNSQDRLFITSTSLEQEERQPETKAFRSEEDDRNETSNRLR